jgi:ribosome-associated translation inhibitor RaiA
MIIEIGLPHLEEEQIERICEIADDKIKNFIFSKISKSKITILEHTIEIDFENNICKIEIELDLEIPSLNDSKVKQIAENAIEKAFESIENELKR